MLGPVIDFRGDDQRMKFSYCDGYFDFMELRYLEDGMEFVDELVLDHDAEDYDDYLNYSQFKWEECAEELERLEDYFVDRCTESCITSHEYAILITWKHQDERSTKEATEEAIETWALQRGL
ncbi:Uu.00g010410.m01.CDS01 [Anthostomella pinea]|uniref:Uu.00g010410.m01.CDS01 n=1 Tax=Anthostomella pinea TaxID=933095 RepID=A0AAI8VXK0_9PEZI|nr:Uu.00g010410.m01.CDS01 [Anthostomella pinea]